MWIAYNEEFNIRQTNANFYREMYGRGQAVEKIRKIVILRDIVKKVY